MVMCFWHGDDNPMVKEFELSFGISHGTTLMTTAWFVVAYF
jgi:hypothetical protein